MSGIKFNNHIHVGTLYLQQALTLEQPTSEHCTRFLDEASHAVTENSADFGYIQRRASRR